MDPIENSGSSVAAQARKDDLRAMAAAGDPSQSQVRLSSSLGGNPCLTGCRMVSKLGYTPLDHCCVGACFICLLYYCLHF